MAKNRKSKTNKSEQSAGRPHDEVGSRRFDRDHTQKGDFAPNADYEESAGSVAETDADFDDLSEQENPRKRQPFGLTNCQWSCSR